MDDVLRLLALLALPVVAMLLRQRSGRTGAESAQDSDPRP
jgi:hypothetical protein